MVVILNVHYFYLKKLIQKEKDKINNDCKSLNPE